MTLSDALELILMRCNMTLLIILYLYGNLNIRGLESLKKTWIIKDRMKVRKFNVRIETISSGYRIQVELNKNVFELDVGPNLEGIEGLLQYLDNTLYNRVTKEIQRQL